MWTAGQSKRRGIGKNVTPQMKMMTQHCVTCMWKHVQAEDEVEG
jgi:hypothetical protein